MATGIFFAEHDAFAQSFPALSTAITSEVITDMQALYYSASNGTPGQQLLLDCQSSIEGLFSNMSQVGYNTPYQSYAESQISGFGSNGSPSSRAPAVEAQFSPAGIGVASSTFGNFVSANQSQIQTQIQDLDSIGVVVMQQRILTELNGSVGGPLSTPASAPGFQPAVAHYGCALCAVECGALALFSPPGLDAIMGLMAVSYDLLAIGGYC